MNILMLIIMLLSFAGYATFIIEHNHHAMRALSLWQKNKEHTYLLEGALFYAIAEFKCLKEPRSLPYSVDLDFEHNALHAHYSSISPDLVLVTVTIELHHKKMTRNCVIKKEQDFLQIITWG